MSPLSALRHPRLATVFALAFLTSCQAGTINFVHVDSGYVAPVMSRIPYTGPLFAEVSGNPFGIPQADLQRRVNDIVQPPGAKAETGQGMRVHIAFGTEVADINSACTMAGNNTMADSISVVAALCRGGGDALTYLTGSISDVKGPDDPRFASFIRQVTIQLFPLRDATQDSNGPCMFPGC